MGLPSINTREDLDAIAGTPEHVAFMALLAGTLWRLEKDDTAQAWVAIEDNSTIERFNFTRADFPDAQPPALPEYAPAAAARATADAAVAAGMSEANRQIAVLQDAVDLAIATDAEAQAYTEWRRYRVLLSRIQSDPAYPNVTLPEQPAKVLL